MNGINIIKIIVAVVVIMMSAASCVNRDPRLDLADGLTEIDSLLSADPDSACALLADYDRSRLSSPFDSAMYRLLWAEGRDKTFCDDTVDTDISRSVEFFRQNGDRRNLMRSLFYQGRIRQNAGLYGEAMIAFQDALENADSTELFYRAKLHTAASEVASAIDDWPRMEYESHKAWECYVRLDSTIFAREAQLWYAMSLAQNKKVEQGMSILQTLSAEAMNDNDTTFQTLVLGYMAKLYLWKDDFHNARKYLFSLHSKHSVSSMSLKDLNLLL